MYFYGCGWAIMSGIIARWFVTALDSTYRWGSSVTPGRGGAKRPTVRATGINGEILKYHSGTRPARRPHYVYRRPPGPFKIACVGGDKDSCQVWAGGGGGETPNAREGCGQGGAERAGRE